MKKSGLILVSLTVAALVIVQSGNAQMRGHMRFPKKGTAMADGSMQGLNLDTEQLEKVTQLRRKYFQDTSDLRIKIMQKREKLSVLVYADKYDEEKINRTVDELSKLEAELTKMELKLSHDIRSLLTPEQKARWDAGGGPMGMGPGSGMCGLGSKMMGGRGHGYGGGMMGPGMMGTCPRGYSPPNQQQ